jgi:hypothetical protein
MERLEFLDEQEAMLQEFKQSLATFMNTSGPLVQRLVASWKRDEHYKEVYGDIKPEAIPGYLAVTVHSVDLALKSCHAARVQHALSHLKKK